MASRWNLDNPIHCEEALNYLYGLPNDDQNSDIEADEDAAEELETLEGSDTSLDSSVRSRSSNYCPIDIQQDDEDNFPDILDVAEPVNEPTLQQTISEDEEEEVEWGKETSYLENLQMDIDHDPELNFHHSFSDKEIDFCSKILSDDFLQTIVDQTNLYAKQARAHKGNPIPQPSKNWIDLTLQELKAFIGCLIFMGIHNLPQLCNFWSSDPCLAVPAISEVMPAKRFKKIVENLHCNDNATALPRNDAKYDKLHKLRPLIDHLNASIPQCYKHSKVLSVDESMVPFKGRSTMKQYMPLKPIKRGYKVWCLADSMTGYILKFEVYTGKMKEGPQLGLGERVVLGLTQSLENKNCLVAFDNFFASKLLAQKLLKKKFFVLLPSSQMKGIASNDED